MTRRAGRLASGALCVCLCITFPRELRAAGEQTVDDLSITTYLDLVHRQPFVRSTARSILYDGQGVRIYNQQVILGHQVSDLTAGQGVFNATVVSDIGYANSSTALVGDITGIYEDCYQARMAANVNAFNLHKITYSASVCVPPEIPDPPDHPKENCPVLLDLSQNGFDLSGPNPPVAFDIDADGTPNRISWTKAGGDDAFLCMDRNHNGLIDDGTELFGYATPLPSGEPSKIGYVALAELDKPENGGNADGIVDARDQLFSSLCVWVDRNRDGISQPGEIYTLPQVAVVALEYRFKDIHLTDRFGNLFRYTSRVYMRTPSGGVRSWPTYDVIFSESP